MATRNITVNCIAPGFIETPMTEKLDDKEKMQFLGSIPMNELVHQKTCLLLLFF